MAKEETKIPELRSAEMHDLLTSPPKVIVRWGTTAITAAIIILMVGSFIVKYPEIVTCKVTVTTSNPPVWVMAKSTGKIKAIYAKDGQMMAKDNIIAVLENTAETDDVLQLEWLVKNVRIDGKEILLLRQLDSNRLGEVQDAYNMLVRAVSAYNAFLSNNVYDQQVKTEEARLASYDNYIGSMKRQQEISKNQHSLSDAHLGREREIYEKGLISKSEFEEAQMSRLNSDLNTEKINSSLHDAEVDVAEIRNTVGELKAQKAKEWSALTTDVDNALNTVRTAIREWKQKYALVSPIDGTLSYNEYWKVNQNVTMGKNVFSIVSNSPETILGKLRVPVEGAGRIKPGQRVNIRLDGYPYLEYGFLIGEVKDISSMYSDESEYSATVSLKKPLKTSYNHEINMKGDLSGTAEVVTQDLSLGERLLSPLRYIYHRNIKRQ